MHKPLPALPLAAAVSAAMLPQLAFAQAADNLSNIVVTASGYEQVIADAPASISVISGEELAKQSYTDITDAVRNIPGVYVTGGGNAQDISIRGMSSQYTLYLVDGRPVSSGRSVNTNGSDGGKQIALPPISMIERIEVVRGPMSSLYGSEAMGGVINIITKRATGEWSGSVTTEYTHSLNDINNDGQATSFMLSGPLIEGLLGTRIHGSWQGTDESDYVGGSDSAASRPDSTRKNGGVELILTPNEDNEFSFGYTAATVENRRTPGGSLAEDAAPTSQRFDKDVYTLSHTGTYDNWIVDSYIQRDVSDRVMDVLRREEIDIVNSQATYFWGNHMLTLGGQYKYEDFTDETNALLSGGVDGAVRNQTRWNASVFAEMEWSITDYLNLTTGMRYDEDENYGGNLSPRAYANYRIHPEWTLKGGISTGYMQPTIAQATEGFGRGTGGAGSPAPHPRAIIIGNPALDPETSVNYETGFVYESLSHDLTSSLTLFHTEFKDKIVEDRLCETPNAERDDPSTWGCPFEGNNYTFISQMMNVDEAEMQGIEFSLDYGITPDVHLSSSYTYTRSEQKTGDFAGDPLNKLPKHMVNIGLDWQTSQRLGLWTEANYRSATSDFLSRTSMDDGTPSYTLVNVGATYALNDNARVRAALYNVADKEITNDTYGVVLDGRSVNVGLTIDF